MILPVGSGNNNTPAAGDGEKEVEEETVVDEISNILEYEYLQKEDALRRLPVPDEEVEDDEGVFEGKEKHQEGEEQDTLLCKEGRKVVMKNNKVDTK